MNRQKELWETNVGKLKLDLLFCHFFTLHCHNILSFVINYTSSSSIIVLLGKWDNIEHILCLSKRSKVFRQTREPLTWTSCCVASHHKRSVLAASTCVKITCCFTKTARSECRSWGVGGCGLGTLWLIVCQEVIAITWYLQTIKDFSLLIISYLSKHSAPPGTYNLEVKWSLHKGIYMWSY